MQDKLQEKTNSHVERMARFLPFSPAHDQIYEEYQQTEDSLRLGTAAFEYVSNAIHSNARIIILTGDAGHGKTYLCRRLIEEHLGYSEDEARQRINTSCDGRSVIVPKTETSHAMPLRVVKDFSELSEASAATLVDECANDKSAVSIICVNEGRLRAVLGSAARDTVSHKIVERFNQTFMDGLASIDGVTHIVNLNYQSVASRGRGESFLSAAIREWTSGTRWRVCNECASRESCPIQRNREMLSDKVDEKSLQRVTRIELLLATLERIGVVVTIRDTLMLIAYLLTGGLRCGDVHKRSRRQKKGWQFAYAFYNLAFEAPAALSSERLRMIPVLNQLSRLDPGRRANRAVDERIVNEQGLFQPDQIDLLFPSREGGRNEFVDGASGIDEVIGNPRNRKERVGEAEDVKRLVRCLRRRAFFDAIAGENSDIRQIGFLNGRDFVQILEGQLDGGSVTRLKRKAISGFHHIQGLQISEREPTLELVDPAFGKSTSRAAILAASVPLSRIQIVRLAEKWKIPEDRERWAASRSVDWLDRHVVLRITGRNDEKNDLLLDLMMFDCLFRASTGHVPSKFYEHDLRRISGFLGRLAQNSRSDSEQIRVMIDGVRHTVSIDGDVIQVGQSGA